MNPPLGGPSACLNSCRNQRIANLRPTGTDGRPKRSSSPSPANYPHGLIARSANRHCGKAECEAASVLSTAQRYTHFLDGPRIMAAMARSDFRFAEPRQHTASVFLALPLTGSTPTAGGCASSSPRPSATSPGPQNGPRTHGRALRLPYPPPTPFRRSRGPPSASTGHPLAPPPPPCCSSSKSSPPSAASTPSSAPWG